VLSSASQSQHAAAADREPELGRLITINHYEHFVVTGEGGEMKANMHASEWAREAGVQSLQASAIALAGYRVNLFGGRSHSRRVCVEQITEACR